MSGKPLNLLPPTGYEYWERVAEIIDREPVHECDRLILGMLAPLGIEKGKPFNPRRAAEEDPDRSRGGRARHEPAISFEKWNGSCVDGSQWAFMLTLTGANQRAAYFDEIDDHADYTFDGIWVGEDMMKPLVGKGSQYLTASTESDNE